jgi:hypothetical protein
MEKGTGQFLSNHGSSIVYLSKNPHSHYGGRSPGKLGLSLRGVQKTSRTWKNGGYVARHKQGRCNQYTLHLEMRCGTASSRTIPSVRYWQRSVTMIRRRSCKYFPQ